MNASTECPPSASPSRQLSHVQLRWRSKSDRLRELELPHRYDEWYTRALMPGVTHISIPDDDTMCNATYQKVCYSSCLAVLQRHAEADRQPAARRMLTSAASAVPARPVQSATAPKAKLHRLQRLRMCTRASA